jgi:hypothetical protein
VSGFRRSFAKFEILIGRVTRKKNKQNASQGEDAAKKFASNYNFGVFMDRNDDPQRLA